LLYQTETEGEGQDQLANLAQTVVLAPIALNSQVEGRGKWFYLSRMKESTLSLSCWHIFQVLQVSTPDQQLLPCHGTEFTADEADLQNLAERKQTLSNQKSPQKSIDRS
jgi:hypothetical protein